MTKPIACLALALALAGGASAQSIDTFPLWNGSNGLDRWGAGGDTPTFGQSFTATASQNNLTAMTFALSRTLGSSTIQYQAYVFAWNGTDATGSALYTSSLQTTPNSASYTQVTVNTGGVALTPGQQYIAFFSTNGVGGNPTVGYNWGMLGTSVFNGFDGYSGGLFAFNNNTDTTFHGGWTLSNTFGVPGADFAFRFDFASVPEPTSLALGALALSGAGYAGWRRRRQAKKQAAAAHRFARRG